MKRITTWTIRHRGFMIALFLSAALLSVVLSMGVRVNFRLADYLPEDAPSTKALNVLEEEFSAPIPSLKVYVKDISLADALALKKTMTDLPGICQVMWLDDVADIRIPLPSLDPDLVSAYYKDNNALFQLSVDTDANAASTVALLRETLGEEAAIAGETADLAASQMAAQNEVTKAMALVVPIILIILLLATISYLEPILFIIVIGVSILINLGTNLFMGEISFLTQSVGPLLQLAVSMDYAIFLLNAFRRFRAEGLPAEEAMTRATQKTASTILASGLTTMIGFLALALMRFKIGPDMGFVLAKGILISMLSAIFLLPGLTLKLLPLLDRTEHRKLTRSWPRASKWVLKVRVPFLILAILITIPCFLAQDKNDFVYGSAGISEGSQIGEDLQLIAEEMGDPVQMVLLVPKNEWAKENQLIAQLKSLSEIQSVVSYDTTVGRQIPPEFLDKRISAQFQSDHYSRLILTADVPQEGEAAFRLTEEIRRLADAWYGNQYLLAGINVNNYDMKDTVTADNRIVNLLAILAVALVLVFTFRSLGIPLALLLTIEGAIFMNMAYPYFAGQSMNYISYLVVNTVQLGATIDYAILFAQHYMEARETLSPRDAALRTMDSAAPSILVPASILTLTGLIMFFSSSNGIVSQFGLVLGRGTAISACMVLLFLPALMTIFDRFIQKTTLRSRASREKGGSVHENM